MIIICHGQIPMSWWSWVRMAWSSWKPGRRGNTDATDKYDKWLIINDPHIYVYFRIIWKVTVFIFVWCGVLQLYSLSWSFLESLRTWCAFRECSQMFFPSAVWSVYVRRSLTWEVAGLKSDIQWYPVISIRHRHNSDLESCQHDDLKHSLCSSICLELGWILHIWLTLSYIICSIYLVFYVYIYIIRYVYVCLCFKWLKAPSSFNPMFKFLVTRAHQMILEWDVLFILIR